MFRNLVDRINRSRMEDPEKFTQKAVDLAIGVGVSALIIVAAVNVASVIVVFPF